ncbi:energy-coupling factor ABC transporter permease [Cytobacillus sp. FJAT-54145]|uniref:Energy-coupling factor ABC transporter permease n=1 Tax=Cytobacillus spartinae TaxID=3299023 RepID=A0ABW6KB43_9BACI
MHIPDGFLSLSVWTSTTAISAAAVALSVKKTKLSEEGSQIPLLGMVTAFIFAAQMINFPVGGATSGHLAGGVLAAILFGPWMATLIMSAVVIIQSLFFQDGGITAIGANLLNVGVIAPWIGYGIYKLFANVKSRFLRSSGIFISAWVSLVLAAVAVSIELWLSGIIPLGVALKAMITWHSIIGIGEGIITVVVVNYLMQRADQRFLLPVKEGG